MVQDSGALHHARYATVLSSRSMAAVTCGQREITGVVSLRVRNVRADGRREVVTTTPTSGGDFYHCWIESRAKNGWFVKDVPDSNFHQYVHTAWRLAGIPPPGPFLVQCLPARRRGPRGWRLTVTALTPTSRRSPMLGCSRRPVLRRPLLPVLAMSASRDRDRRHLLHLGCVSILASWNSGSILE